MKLCRIAAGVLALSIAAAGFGIASVYGQTEKCRITETTVTGNAGAAAGLSVSFGMGIPNKLYWENTYLYDGKDTQKTVFNRDNVFEEKKKNPVPAIDLHSYTTGISALDYILTDEAEGDPQCQKDLETLRQEFFAEDAREKLRETAAKLPAGGTQSRRIALKELFRYYPLEGELTAADGIYAVSIENAIWAQEKYRKLWADVNSFLRIPVPETESSGWTVTKYPDDTLRLEYCNESEKQEPGEESFYFRSIACSTPEAVYFTFDPHTDRGGLVDTSLIPGGYGIYRVPYDEEKKTFCSDAIETVYTLDPEKTYTALYTSPDSSKLFLVSLEAIAGAPKESRIRAAAEVIDIGTMTCEDRQELFRGADAALGYDGGDYLVFGDRNAKLCLYAYQDGRYEKKLQLSDVDFSKWALGSLFSGEGSCRAAYDGRRLAILSTSYLEGAAEDDPDGLWQPMGSVDTAVFDEQGLSYYGTLRTNLQDFYDEESYLAWKAAVDPRNGESTWYRLNRTFKRYNGKVSWNDI